MNTLIYKNTLFVGEAVKNFNFNFNSSSFSPLYLYK